MTKYACQKKFCSFSKVFPINFIIMKIIAKMQKYSLNSNKPLTFLIIYGILKCTMDM